MKLPESWVGVRLADVCEIGSGDGAPQEEQWFVQEGNLFVRTSDVSSPRDGAYITNTRDKLSDVALEQLRLRTWKKNSLLFPKSGASALLNQRALLGVDACVVSHLAVLLPSEQVHHEYLYWWSTAFDAARVVLDSSYPSIRLQDLGRVKLPLPTLPEQQRIVDVLRQAEEVAKTKRSINEQIDQLVRTLYWEHFGAWYTVDGLRDPVRISEFVDDSQYGVSEAMGESGSHAVLRMNSITTSGWLDLADLKYAGLSKKDAESTILQNGDLLFNRTNSKELVGKCAIWRDAEGVFSFASYLIRLRLKDGMLPEYLWATLNSAYGKYRLMNSAKQAGSMANVSPTDLGRITVPLPPPNLQEDFARLVKQIEEIRLEMLLKVESFEELQNIVTQQALIGELTEIWREKHRREIEVAAAIRDTALGKRTAKVSVQIIESAPTERPTSFPRPARQWLIKELSTFQHEVWNTLRYEWRGSVIVDDPEVFDDFCTSPQTAWRIEDFKASSNRIRRALEQLAAVGLIAKISVPKLNPLSQQTEYLTAFRPLREEENTRLADADLMRRSLSVKPSGGNE